MKSEADVAIVGGGFSGTLALIHLIRGAAHPLTIFWCDETDRFGRGAAYSTKEYVHLLNVRADRMGAFPEDVEGFWAWLQIESNARAAHAMVPDLTLAPDAFLPRAVYGVYLATLLEQALTSAQGKGIEITQSTQSCNRITRELASEKWMLAFGQEIRSAKAVILATGNLPPRPLAVDGTGGHYIEQIWTAGLRIFRDTGALADDSVIAVLGTGLTAVDSVLSLMRHGFKGRVVLLSRHGWLPAVHAHAAPYPAWEWTERPQHAPKTALGLLTGIRAEIRRARAKKVDWRGVIDSLRPVTRLLWNNLPNREKRRFLKKLATLWSIHRHRMAPSIHAQMQASLKTGRLQLVNASLTHAQDGDAGMTLTLRHRGQANILNANLLLNCTGPELDITRVRHPLLTQMAADALLVPHPTRAGVQMGQDGRAASEDDAPLYVMGNLRVGALLECTAVPELREQAKDVAQSVLAQIKDLRKAAV